MRIAIVDVESLLLQKLSLIIDMEPNFEAVAFFATAEEAFLKMEDFAAELVLTELKLPTMSRITELIAKTKEKNATINFLVFSAHEEREAVISTFRAGASGYILKGGSLKELIEAINYIQDGGISMCRKISRIVINELCNHSVSNDSILTGKEQSILKCIEIDLSYKEIAENLGISCHTVHAHIKSIFRKLKASCRRDAVKKARRSGLL